MQNVPEGEPKNIEPVTPPEFTSKLTIQFVPEDPTEEGGETPAITISGLEAKLCEHPSQY